MKILSLAKLYWGGLAVQRTQLHSQSLPCELYWERRRNQELSIFPFSERRYDGVCRLGNMEFLSICHIIGSRGLDVWILSNSDQSNGTRKLESLRWTARNSLGRKSVSYHFDEDFSVKKYRDVVFDF